jgi:hypothetical protein
MQNQAGSKRADAEQSEERQGRTGLRKLNRFQLGYFGFNLARQMNGSRAGVRPAAFIRCSDGIRSHFIHNAFATLRWL